MADMGGKVVLITGATNGIGKAAALEIASMGATTVLVGRDAAKTDRVVAEIRQKSGNQDVHGLLADLSLMAEVRSLAAVFIERFDRLDVLLNNAGAGFSERKLTAEGIEQTFALNHLSYFLLTTLLLDRLKASAPARIVNVASDAHFTTTIDLSDLEFERRSIGRSGFTLYGASKLANILFTRELARQLAGSGVTANALNPGMVATGIWRNSKGLTGFITGTLGPLFMRSPEKGAETLEESGGVRTMSPVTRKMFSPEPSET
jgi:NAD(P)-dependent dehydrogenase (short-subunit alcohol dehydrogenase family)